MFLITGGVMANKDIQKAYEKTVLLTEVFKDFGPDDRKNRQFTKLLVKKLVAALKSVPEPNSQVKVAIKEGDKWLK